MLVAMVVSFALTFGIVLPLATVLRRKGRQARLGALSAALSAEAPRELAVPGERRRALAFELKHGEAAVQVYSVPRGNYERMMVALRGPALPRIVLRRETGIDRFGKRLRLNREVQTGDQEFDAKVYIESDERDRVIQQVLASPAVKQAALAILDSGLLTLSMGPAGASARLNRAGAKSVYQVDAAAVRRAVEKLAALAQVLPAVDGAEIRKPGRARGDLMVLISLVGFIVAAVGYYALPLGLTDYASPALPSDQDRVFGGSFVAWLLLIPATWLWVRGHSRSLRNFLTIVLTSIYPMLTLVPEAAFAANAAFDPGPETVVQAMVAKRNSYRTKKARRYLTVTSWHKDAERIALQVSKGTWQRFNEGDPVQLRLRPGTFGWEWVAAFEQKP